MDGVHIHPHPHPFAREIPAEMGHASLACSIGAVAFPGQPRGDRSDDHHPAVFLFPAAASDQTLGPFARHQVDALEIGIEQYLQPVRRHLGRSPRCGNTGIGDNRVDRAKCRLCRVIGGDDRSFIGDIQRNSQRLATRINNLFCQSICPVRSPGTQHDIGARSRK